MKTGRLQKYSNIADILDLKGKCLPDQGVPRRQNIDGLARMWHPLREELDAIPGIGKDLTAKIREFLATGRWPSTRREKGDLPGGCSRCCASPASVRDGEAAP